MIQTQCSVTLHSWSQLPQLRFDCTQPQLHFPSQSIPLLKAFFAAGAWIKVSATTTTSDTDTITLVIPNSQVAILAKKGLLLFIKA